MTDVYYRPQLNSDLTQRGNARLLRGGRLWFDRLERITRDGVDIVSISDAPTDVIERITHPLMGFTKLYEDRPLIMGILNVTPDSFSDGGHHDTLPDAIGRARQMIADGADIIDIGGESTRPGAAFVPADVEIVRTIPVIEALRADGMATTISIDTRKADVARAAFEAGADLFNDVSALTYDENSLQAAREVSAPICLMHAAGDPKTMQDNPNYDDVLLDVYDYLSARIQACEAAGIDRSRIITDPGIGFGKTMDHNLRLLRNLSLFHGLGCPILLGASRKRFIGTISNETDATKRVAGSVAVALDALNHGVQILRVHDVKETKQAVDLWSALHPRQE